jgi:hypothetical protein
MHLGTKPVEDASKLDCNVAATDDGHLPAGSHDTQTT